MLDVGVNRRAFDPLNVKFPPESVEIEPQTVYFLGFNVFSPEKSTLVRHSWRTLEYLLHCLKIRVNRQTSEKVKIPSSA
jgi:hypothetical protein